MTPRQHRYDVQVSWTGNLGEGTGSYTSYERSYMVDADGKPSIPGSSDPAFRGDSKRWSPEEMLVASLSARHQLWYLHLCAEAGVQVVSYVDQAEGRMLEEEDGSGQFSEVTLRPRVQVSAGSDVTIAEDLHRRASELCFIGRSMGFPVRHEAQVSRTS